MIIRPWDNVNKPDLTNSAFEASACPCSPHTRAANVSNRSLSQGCASANSEGKSELTVKLKPHTSCSSFGIGGPPGAAASRVPPARAGGNLTNLPSPPLLLWADGGGVWAADSTKTSFARYLPSAVSVALVRAQSDQLPISSGARGSALASVKPWLKTDKRHTGSSHQGTSRSVGLVGVVTSEPRRHWGVNHYFPRRILNSFGWSKMNKFTPAN